MYFLHENVDYIKNASTCNDHQIILLFNLSIRIGTVPIYILHFKYTITIQFSSSQASNISNSKSRMELIISNQYFKKHLL